MLVEKIAVVTDGSLPTNSKSVHQVVPFYVQYQDFEDPTNWVSVHGDQMPAEKFLEIQRISKKEPSTAQPSPHDFLQAYVALVDEGYNCILVLTVPATKSGTYNSAVTAVKLLQEHRPGLKVRLQVIDTGTTVAGIKYLAEEAMALVERREFFDQIVHRLEWLRDKVEIIFILDTIRYIGSSGRVAELAHHRVADTLKRYARGLAAWFAKVSHHSPKVAITFKGGEEKIVGFSRFYAGAAEILTKEVEKRELEGRQINRIYIYQRDSGYDLSQMLDRITLFTNAEIVVEEQIPLALLGITGPKFIALVCIYD